jgi:hypothetical protein
MKYKIKKFGKPDYKLTKEERRYIYSFGVRGLKNKCHAIAQRLTILSNGDIKYCEGVMICEKF